jgi:hypothetical protein
LPLQLVEDVLFMFKEVAHESVAVSLVHCEVVFQARAENAWCEILCEGGHITLVGGREFDQSCKVGHDGIERGDIIQSKLAESALEDLDAVLLGSLTGSGGVDGADDLIYLG